MIMDTAAGNAETDFNLRCLPEDVSFPVQRAKLFEGSETFADMFSCCKGPNDVNKQNSVDIYDSSDSIAILVRLLHSPPGMLSKNIIKTSRTNGKLLSPVIPYLLLPRIFIIAERYSLKSSIMEVLQTHLAAQAPIAPLLVYGLATQYSLPDIADRASKFLISVPLENYSSEEIKIIPSTEAYHKILRLQAYRKGRIKELLMKEDLFPHGYGTCTVHQAYAEAAWNQKRRRLVGKVHSGTNVGSRMSRGLDAKIRQCKICQKAWIAATEMLAYKCKRVARRISQLPADYT